MPVHTVAALDTHEDQHRISPSLSNSTCRISHALASRGATLGRRQSALPTLDDHYCVTARRRVQDRAIATLTPSLGFSAARFQSRSLTRPDPSSRFRLPGCAWQRLATTLHSILKGRRYMLELSKGPRFLEVPPESDFSARADVITDAMPAYMCRTRHALSIRPECWAFTTFTSFRRSPGSPTH